MGEGQVGNVFGRDHRSERRRSAAPGATAAAAPAKRSGELNALREELEGPQLES